MTNPSFKSFEWQNGELYRDTNSQYPCKLHAIVGCQPFLFSPGSSYYIYVYTGFAFIGRDFPLHAGMFASCTEKQFYVSGSSNCRAIIIERVHHPINGNIDMAVKVEGFQYVPFSAGGPIEDAGRLKYIDGCTDSLLIAPWKLGEPCLNHLHFPAAINQTPHTHPTIRIGLVAKGSGECITPFGNIPLTEGMIFAILPENGNEVPGMDGKYYAEGTHSFRTFDIEMDVIAFHPDSDYGPQDENHPMINRTIVNGTPANQIDEIRTK